MSEQGSSNEIVEALKSARDHLNVLAFGGFGHDGVIPRHYKLTWGKTIEVISQLQSAIDRPAPETFRDGLFPAWKPITDRPKESGGYWIWSPATGSFSEWVGHWAYRADLGRWGTEGDYSPQSGSYWMPLPKPPRAELKASGCPTHGMEHFFEGMCIKCGVVPPVSEPEQPI